MKIKFFSLGFLFISICTFVCYPVYFVYFNKNKEKNAIDSLCDLFTIARLYKKIDHLNEKELDSLADKVINFAENKVKEINRFYDKLEKELNDDYLDIPQVFSSKTDFVVLKVSNYAIDFDKELFAFNEIVNILKAKKISPTKQEKILNLLLFLKEKVDFLSSVGKLFLNDKKVDKETFTYFLEYFTTNNEYDIFEKVSLNQLTIKIISISVGKYLDKNLKVINKTKDFNEIIKVIEKVLEGVPEKVKETIKYFSEKGIKVNETISNRCFKHYIFENFETILKHVYFDNKIDIKEKVLKYLEKTFSFGDTTYCFSKIRNFYLNGNEFENVLLRIYESKVSHDEIFKRD